MLGKIVQETNTDLQFDTPPLEKTPRTLKQESWLYSVVMLRVALLKLSDAGYRKSRNESAHTNSTDT